MFDHIIKRKSALLRLGNEMIRQLAQVTHAVSAVSCFVRPRRHKRADTAPRYDYSAALEFRVYLGYGVRVYPQVDRQLPHRRQLVPNAQPAGGNGKANRPVKLVIKRRWVFKINLKHCFTIVLRQSNTASFEKNESRGTVSDSGSVDLCGPFRLGGEFLCQDGAPRRRRRTLRCAEELKMPSPQYYARLWQAARWKPRTKSLFVARACSWQELCLSFAPYAIFCLLKILPNCRL